jgi:hypothetical protein
MSAWFVPPVVIPFAIVIVVAILAVLKLAA